ncbi:MAG: sulfotransferase, partial [Planctomycetes bacterium]|nr:sulfotransferase [Planctomycetota bacterium]
FPRIQFIHVVRDPRHGLLSQVRYRQRQRRRGWSVDGQRFDELCRTWALHQEQLLDALDPGNSIRVDYRQMLRSPRQVFDRVQRFLRLPRDENALRVFEERSAGGHATSGSEAASLEAWRDAWSAEQLTTIERVCGPVARRLDLPVGAA